VGQIGLGLVILLGVGQGDDEAAAEQLAEKVLNLRIFQDEASKFNLGALDVGADILVISEFTLYCDCRKGRRPNFVEAAPPDVAARLYEYFTAVLARSGLKVEKGVFAAHMMVDIVNDGPVTLMLATDLPGTSLGIKRSKD